MKSNIKENIVINNITTSVIGVLFILNKEIAFVFNIPSPLKGNESPQALAHAKYLAIHYFLIMPHYIILTFFN